MSEESKKRKVVSDDEVASTSAPHSVAGLNLLTDRGYSGGTSKFGSAPEYEAPSGCLPTLPGWPARGGLIVVLRPPRVPRRRIKTPSSASSSSSLSSSVETTMPSLMSTASAPLSLSEVPVRLPVPTIHHCVDFFHFLSLMAKLGETEAAHDDDEDSDYDRDSVAAQDPLKNHRWMVVRPEWLDSKGVFQREHEVAAMLVHFNTDKKVRGSAYIEEDEPKIPDSDDDDDEEKEEEVDRGGESDNKSDDDYNPKAKKAELKKKKAQIELSGWARSAQGLVDDVMKKFYGRCRELNLVHARQARRERRKLGRESMKQQQPPKKSKKQQHDD